MEEQLYKAIELAKAGRKMEARELLILVLIEDSSNLVAWKWYASVADSRAEAWRAIDSILQLDPNDPWARRAHASLEAERVARPTRRSETIRAGTPPSRGGVGLAVGLAAVLMVLCVAAVALALLGSNLNVSGLAGDALGVTNTPAPLVASGPTTNPPTLPATWTASPVPTLLTATPLPTLTPTNTPGPTVTPQPTPAVVDPPPQSDFDQVPLDQLPAGAGPVIQSQQVTYYPVTGSNADEINASILANGPKGNGQDAIAQVAYSISLHYTFNQFQNGCSASQAVAYLDLVFTYPQYSPPSGVSQEILNQWAAFEQRVVVHEETHANIAHSCAEEMVDGFYRLPVAPSCAALQADLEALQSQEDAACDQQQIAFDVAEGGDSFP